MQGENVQSLATWIIKLCLEKLEGQYSEEFLTEARRIFSEWRLRDQNMVSVDIMVLKKS